MWRRRQSSSPPISQPADQFEDPFPNVALRPRDILSVIGHSDTGHGLVHAAALGIAEALRPAVAKDTLTRTIDDWLTSRAADLEQSRGMLPDYLQARIPGEVIEAGNVIVDGLSSQLAHARELRRMLRETDPEVIIKSGLELLHAQVTIAYELANTAERQVHLAADFQGWLAGRE